MTDHQLTIQAARRLAGHIKALGGPDLTGLDDDELMEAMTTASIRMAEAVQSFGVSMEQAGEALMAIGQAMRSIKNEKATHGQGD